MGVHNHLMLTKNATSPLCQKLKSNARQRNESDTRGYDHMLPRRDVIRSLTLSSSSSFFFFLVSYVGERPWWPIQCLNIGRRKKEAKG